MTSRKRMLAVASGLPTDLVPVMYWLNAHMTCRLLAQHQPGLSRIATLPLL